MKSSSLESIESRFGRPNRGFPQSIFSILLGTCLFAAAPAYAQADTEAPVIEIVDVEVTKLGTDHYSFTFYFLAEDNVEVDGIEFRGAVNRGQLDSWKSWPYLGSDYPFPIQLFCWAFDFEVRAVDAAGNRSVAAKWSFGSRPVKPVIQAPSSVKGEVGEALRFRIRARGASRYRVIGLPKGLALNKRTGWITGKPKRAGRYRVVLGAVKSSVSARKTVIFQISQ